MYYATEARLHRGADGRAYSDLSQVWYENHVLWLDSFDEVRIVARVEAKPRHSGRLVEGEGVTVLPVPSYKGARAMVFQFLQTRRLIRRAVTDVDAIYGGRLPGVIGAITVGAGKRIGAKTFAHVVGDPYDLLKSGVAGWLGAKAAIVAKLLMVHQIANADGAIYVSERTLQDRYPVGPGALSLVRSGIVLDGETLAAQAKVPNAGRKTTTIVAVGTHDQMYKGHDLLLRAVARLTADGVNVSLGIVGGGSKHEVLVNLARELRVDPHVHFYGHVETPQQVRAILDGADLFAMPSRTEGVPRALVEAMARGLPCIGSDIGGIPELLPPECLFTSGSVEELTALLRKAVSNNEWLVRQGALNLERAQATCETLDPNRVSEFFRALTRTPMSMNEK